MTPHGTDSPIVRTTSARSACCTRRGCLTHGTTEAVSGCRCSLTLYNTLRSASKSPGAVSKSRQARVCDAAWLSRVRNRCSMYQAQRLIQHPRLEGRQARTCERRHPRTEHLPPLTPSTPGSWRACTHGGVGLVSERTPAHDARLGGLRGGHGRQPPRARAAVGVQQARHADALRGHPRQAHVTRDRRAAVDAQAQEDQLRARGGTRHVSSRVDVLADAYNHLRQLQRGNTRSAIADCPTGQHGR